MLWEQWFSQTLREHLFLHIFCIIGAPLQILGNKDYGFFLKDKDKFLGYFQTAYPSKDKDKG